MVIGTKLWETSIIGYFIGGSFDYKFVREQTMKMWSNKRAKESLLLSQKDTLLFVMVL